jgi:hypothetical protein
MPRLQPRRLEEANDSRRSLADDAEPLDVSPLIEPDADLSERVRQLAKLVRKNILDQK